MGATSELPATDVMRITGLPSGTLYPIMVQLEKAGWIKSRWEDVDPPGAARRRNLYMITRVGKANAVAATKAVTAPLGAM